MVLDFNEFSGGLEERQDIAGPLPRYLYDRNPFNDLPYLLSWNVLLRSWRIVSADRSERFTSDPGVPWYWGDLKRFGRGEVLRGLDLAHLNSRFGQPQRTLAGMRASFEHNLLPLLASHPGTQFDLVWPPYSILVWLDFAQRDQLEVSLEFKRYVFAATRGLPNVAITDLQSEEGITHDLDRYTDIYHFDPAINERLIEAVCSGAALDADRLDESERRLREQVAAVRRPRGSRVSSSAPLRRAAANRLRRRVGLRRVGERVGVERVRRQPSQLGEFACARRRSSPGRRRRRPDSRTDRRSPSSPPCARSRCGPASGRPAADRTAPG